MAVITAEHGEKQLARLTSYTFTPHLNDLIMGQVFFGTHPWPAWPIHINLLTHLTHDPLSALRHVERIYILFMQIKLQTLDKIHKSTRIIW